MNIKLPEHIHKEKIKEAPITLLFNTFVTLNNQKFSSCDINTLIACYFLNNKKTITVKSIQKFILEKLKFKQKHHISTIINSILILIRYGYLQSYNDKDSILNQKFHLLKQSDTTNYLMKTRNIKIKFNDVTGSMLNSKVKFYENHSFKKFTNSPFTHFIDYINFQLISSFFDGHAVTKFQINQALHIPVSSINRICKCAIFHNIRIMEEDTGKLVTCCIGKKYNAHVYGIRIKLDKKFHNSIRFDNNNYISKKTGQYINLDEKKIISDLRDRYKNVADNFGKDKRSSNRISKLSHNYISFASKWRKYNLFPKLVTSAFVGNINKLRNSVDWDSIKFNQLNFVFRILNLNPNFC